MVFNLHERLLTPGARGTKFRKAKFTTEASAGWSQKGKTENSTATWWCFLERGYVLAWTSQIHVTRSFVGNVIGENRLELALIVHTSAALIAQSRHLSCRKCHSGLAKHKSEGTQLGPPELDQVFGQSFFTCSQSRADTGRHQTQGPSMPLLWCCLSEQSYTSITDTSSICLKDSFPEC